MRAEQVTQQLLLASSAVQAIVAGRVYPGKIPQNSPMPTVTFELVSSVEVGSFAAASGGAMLRSRMQVTAFAKTVIEVKQLQEAIRKAVLFQRGQFVFVPPQIPCVVNVVSIVRDLIGPDTRDFDLALFMQSVDYLITHDEI